MCGKEGRKSRFSRELTRMHANFLERICRSTQYSRADGRAPAPLCPSAGVAAKIPCMNRRHVLPLLCLPLLAFGLSTLTAQNNAATPRKVGQNRPRGVEMEVRAAHLQWSKDTTARRIEGRMDGFSDDVAIGAAGRAIDGEKRDRVLKAT